MATTIAAPAQEGTRRRRRIQRTDQLLREAQRYHGATRESRLQEVIELNAPVARSIARQFRGRGEALEDLEQVGYLGLTKAVHGFDPKRGQEFLPYAIPTITGELKRHFRDVAWAVRPPRRIQELQGEISPAIQELVQEYGRQPRPGEIARHLDCDEGDVVEALACGGCFTPSSLDDRGPGGDGYSVAERLKTSEGGYSRVEAVHMLSHACQSLKPRDRRILYLRFFKDRTQEQIAGELGVTQMQVSRLLSRIMRDLRRELTLPHEPRLPLAG
jgi:RNA polymerase sigma-B factor